MLSSGSISISIEELAGEENILIPIASNHQSEITKTIKGDILNFDGVTISPFANTLIKFSICSNLVSFSVTSYWS